MKANASAYLSEIVAPTIAEFRDDPSSRRRAFLACVATFHCIDYMAHRSQNLRDQFRKESKDFALVDRVAHAFKHARSGNPNSPRNQPLHASLVFERPPARAGVAQSGLSRVGDSRGGVEIWSEAESDVLRAVTKAAEFLRGKIEVEER
ncbi:hypothetical protein J6524_06895 [Bradyrhizobium sp. WSM 1738]|uniref:hypothetical protein n=1 Tax=Bradyrhizobium hereditatis TaxID=2821405 RepID=UPI001CE33A63|nr:hypothetical protein [Bradyrhizobium hereditatis]MCA6114646.1 hypothetical protein [Bradyrhizobium hereditatis]